MPPSKLQAEKLRGMLSKTSFTYDRLTLGTINNSRDPNRDRKIMESVDAIEKALSKHKNLAREGFAKAKMQGVAKDGFNRATGIER